MKLKGYWKPTPKKMRQLGDAFLAIAVYGEVHSQTINPTVGAILTYGGIAGKFLTNFCSEDDAPAQS